MTVKKVALTAMRTMRAGLISAAVFQFAIGNSLLQAQNNSHDNDTTSPIKHVIVIIGENRSFDHVFATYVPKKGNTVWNLLSEGIVNADGTPGPNFPLAEQKHADVRSSDGYLLSPPAAGVFLGNVLPAPLNGGPTD